MRTWGFLLSICLIVTSTAFAARDNFEAIDGKNYYEFLGVEITSDTATIKTTYYKIMKANHPDQGGDVEFLKKVNRAYETLSKKRDAYDIWLKGNSGTGNPKGPESYQSSSDSEDYEARDEKVRNSMAAEIATEITQRGGDPSVLTDAQLAEIARFTIVYQQRFLRGSSIDAGGLRALIYHYALTKEKYKTWPAMALKAVAFGVITILKERAAYDHNGSYQRELRSLKILLESEIGWESNDKWWRIHLDEIYKFMEGRSFLNPPPPPPPPTDCASALRTTLKFRDQHGREWEIPLTVEVKIGR